MTKMCDVKGKLSAAEFPLEVARERIDPDALDGLSVAMQGIEPCRVRMVRRHAVIHGPHARTYACCSGYGHRATTLATPNDKAAAVYIKKPSFMICFRLGGGHDESPRPLALGMLHFACH